MAWAIQFDGVNDYFSYSVSNDSDILKISARLKIADGDASGDLRLIAFDPSGAAFYGFGVYNNKLRIYARGNNSQATALSSSQTIDTDTFFDAVWQFNKSTGKASVFVDAVETSTTNASNTSHNTTLTSSVVGATTTSSGFIKAQMSYVEILDTTTPANSFKLDATASDHSNTGTQPVLVDTIGGNNAVGVNFPTDGSAWVDLGGGGGGVSLTVTETKSSSLNNSSIEILANLSIIVTETKSPSINSSLLAISSQGVTLAVTEMKSSSIDSAVIDITSNISALVTEVKSSRADFSATQIQRDIESIVTEVRASSADSSILNIPVTITISKKNMVRVKRETKAVRVKRETKTVRVKRNNKIIRVR